MKKFTLIFLTFLTLLSCSDEVQFNTPGFQGNKNYNLWRATFFNAVVNADGLTITAGNNSEDMTIRLSSFAVTGNENPYLLTDTSFSRAEFIDFENIEYSTSNLADPSVSLYPEIGEVYIDESTPEYISGTFRFIAFTADGLKSVGFNEGTFYRIPITGGNSANNLCQQASANALTAMTNFTGVTLDDPTYPTVCNAYRTALQQQITACGDQSGALQNLINNLGDCAGSDMPEGVISVTVGTLAKTFETNITIMEAGGILSVRAEDDATDDWISFDVSSGETGVDIISNFVIHLITTDYFPASNPTGTFTSEITINTTPSIQGTFAGPVESADGADLSLTQGVIDIIE